MPGTKRADIAGRLRAVADELASEKLLLLEEVALELQDIESELDLVTAEEWNGFTLRDCPGEFNLKGGPDGAQACSGAGH